MTSVSDLVFIDATGYNYGSYPDFLAWITAQYQGIYGADVYIDPDSMDGQFLAILAQAFYDTAALGNSVYSSFSPLTSQGAGLSRVVKINGIARLSPSYSTATVTIVGTAGTVITNGVVQDTLNQLWNLPSTVTIPFAGTIDVTATAQVIGFVTAEIGTITILFTPTLGWQTANNAAAATPGEPVETDAQLRQRQSVSTALPAQTVFDATLGAVANVTGVTKVEGYENFTDTAVGLLTPHSICVATVGGAGMDIANAITAQKTPGTNPIGNTGPFSTFDARGMPLSIYYTVAMTASIQVTVNVASGVGWSTDFVVEMETAVAAYINALNIGSTVFFTQLFVPAYLIGTPAQGTFSITSLTIGKNGGSQSAANISLVTGFNAENPVCNPLVDVNIVVT